MVTARMTLKGMPELTKALKRIGENIDDVLEEAVMAGAEVAREDASRRAPKRTGKLSRRIIAKIADQSHQMVASYVGPDETVYYGKFVELGTKKTKAKPFLRPAFDENNKEIRKAVRNVLKSALKRSGLR